LTTSGKIRLLLALLFVSLLFTAIVVQSAYTPVDNLDQTAGILKKNLHKKESYIVKVFDDKASYNRLKKLQDNPTAALNFIEEFTTNRQIWVVTFTNDTLSFWSGIKAIPPDNRKIKEGVSFIKEPNGYYEAIKKSDGRFSAIFLIPVKINYPFQNQYLQNKFAPDLLADNNIEIADFTDNNVYGIHSSINNQYLFSVKLDQDRVNSHFFDFEFTTWLLTFITLCVLIHAICKYLINKRHVILSLIFLALFIVTIRFLNLHYNWPGFINILSIFNGSLYSAGGIYRSFGDYCLNTLFIVWFTAFLYTQRNHLLKNIPGKFVSYLILIACSAILLASAVALIGQFFGLVSNSKISFDVYNVFNLSKFSVIGLLMLCCCFLIFFLLNDTFLAICSKLPIPDTHKIILFIAFVITGTFFISTDHQLYPLFILLIIPVLLRGYAYKQNEGRIDSTSFIIIVAIFAIISFIRYYRVESIKETQTRETLIAKLEIPDDPTADALFKKIEKLIIADPLVVKYFQDTLQYNNLKNRFQKLYFDDYLSKYAYSIHEFNNDGLPLNNDKKYALNIFSDMVLYSAFKVSDYFYRENESFGFQHYFGILPVTGQGKILGTIVVELRSRPLQPAGSFPDLLKDASIKQDNEFNDYSFAFYSDNKLVSNSGTYGYDLINTRFNGQLNKYTTITNNVNNYPEWYNNLTVYRHLIFKPSPRTLIVVSKEENSLFRSVTSLTFFFILLLLFSIIIISVRWLWLRIKILNIKGNRLKWILKIKFDRILYKTRIQFSIVSAVVLTLILVGFVTFFSLSTQYTEQQENMIRDKITHITAAYASGLFDRFLSNINDESQVDFDELASTYSTDLVLYNQKGIPLITTQPRIYEDGLQPRRMNAKAFINLTKLKKSEFTNEEVIGELRYKAVYAPLRNSKNVTVAYLQLPYFSNEADYNARMVSLLNIMINVYALIFIVIGLFAVIIARQITAPLSFIQLNLGKIIYGRKNEPIKWERDDEIGALVNEYNKMIAALENSAQKLAQSERESAWREMAKQVAHEIKNPLTPLKLGLQLLEKSWKDKDPKFDQKFERFSKSFVEQIESLSSIASEFSSFARMPDTHLERINIFDMLNQAVVIFVQMDNIKINFQQPGAAFYIKADRDQLLRCFNNLLKNAIEATQHRNPGIIDINYVISKNNILLSIKDNGNGIPEQMRDKIFEPNFTTKSSGTGLGLAFVKNSIENASGSVWFDTIQGVGTTFYLSLPAAV
jgi:two-component system, NtrC family, nitrogen regulation sensor histidine kinase NtrY